MSTLYVNRPGGVITRRADGTGVHLAYGEALPDDLDPTVDPSPWADPTPRVPNADHSAIEAARRAALADAGSPLSSSNPVPGNYGDLDENGAAVLVTRLRDYPQQQAAILVHEAIHGGNRQLVKDSATAEARALADQQLGVPAAVVSDVNPDESEQEAPKPKPAAKAAASKKTPPPSGD